MRKTKRGDEPRYPAGKAGAASPNRNTESRAAKGQTPEPPKPSAKGHTPEPPKRSAKGHAPASTKRTSERLTPEPPRATRTGAAQKPASARTQADAAHDAALRAQFLPVTREDMRARGWEVPDFVLISGDAYVDHPSFGVAIIGRWLEKLGFRVAILAQPDWRTSEAFGRLGRPRLGFLITSGNIDSMVNHYTAARKRRSQDVYSPGGRPGLRPDRAVIVYANRAREAFPDVPIILGGIEASLRRFAQYDYWDDAVRRSILVDSEADLLVYGMGESAIAQVAQRLGAGEAMGDITDVRGTCVIQRDAPGIPDAVTLPSFEEVQRDKRAYARAFAAMEREQDPVRGKTLLQAHGTRWLRQNPPAMPLATNRLDAVFALPYMREPHPDYAAAGGVPAIEEVRFSILATRGCYGGCSFCALNNHQGRIVRARSDASVLQEARIITNLRDFKGYIHDVGGPTANFREPACEKQLKSGACADRQCLYPGVCPAIRAKSDAFIKLLREIRVLPGVKKVFIRSGIRYDVLLSEGNDAFLRELCQHHISGQLKIAPEHVSPRVLAAMGKPGKEVYERFVKKYSSMNEELGKEQYLVPYFISSHPGSDLDAAVELAEYMRDHRIRPEQVQDFYPTPGTRSTCMFHTGLDPETLRPVHVPRDAQEKAMQRALLQYSRPQNHALVRKALRLCGREDLIGRGGKCLVPHEADSRAWRTDRPAKPGAGVRGKAPRPPRATGEAPGSSRAPGEAPRSQGPKRPATKAAPARSAGSPSSRSSMAKPSHTKGPSPKPPTAKNPSSKPSAPKPSTARSSPSKASPQRPQSSKSKGKPRTERTKGPQGPHSNKP